MKILITGGLGFIGHELVRCLRVRDHEVWVIDNMTNYDFIPLEQMMKLFQLRMGDHRNQVPTRMVDIRDQQAVEKTFDAFRPDVVIHLASYPRQKLVSRNPGVASEVMCNGLINLLEASRKSKTGKFVYVSSSMAYGDFNDMAQETHECRPQGQYAIMKYMGEKLVEDYCKHFDYTILRPSAVYGPRDVEDRVVSKFVLNALRGHTIEVRGASEILDFTYSMDAAQGIALASTKTCRHDIYNITRCQDDPVTLELAAEQVVELVGQGRIEVVDRDMDFPKRGRLSIERARTDLGYDPDFDFSEGLPMYVDWVRSNYDKLFRY